MPQNESKTYQIDNKRLPPLVEVPDGSGIIEPLHRRAVEPQENVIVAEAINEVILVLPPLDLLLPEKLLLFRRRPLVHQVLELDELLLHQVSERLQDLARARAGQDGQPLFVGQTIRNCLPDLIAQGKSVLDYFI